MPWIDQAPTVLQAWFAGNECGNALADVLFGEVNPSARLPLTFPSNIEDCTAHLNWGAESGKVTYGESIFVSATRPPFRFAVPGADDFALQVGYRGYDMNKSVPLFHFGHGLSYSTFGPHLPGPYDTAFRGSLTFGPHSSLDRALRDSRFFTSNSGRHLRSRLPHHYQHQRHPGTRSRPALHLRSVIFAPPAAQGAQGVRQDTRSPARRVHASVDQARQAVLFVLG